MFLGSIRVISLLVIDVFKRIVRNIYWLYNLARAPFGANFRFSWPVIVEGKGMLRGGSGIKFGRNTKFACGEGSLLQFGNNVIIDNNCTLLVGKRNSFYVGQNSSFGEHTRLIIQNEWQIGEKVVVANYCEFFSRESGYGGRLIIGDRTNVGDNTILDICDDIRIGNDVALGPHCILYTHDHGYQDKTLPAWKGPIHAAPIVVEDGAWIGARVTILPGVRIGKRAVVAAGAVVTSNVPAETIWGGIPARQLKTID